MAKISESTGEPTGKDSVDGSDFDSKTMRTTKPGLKRLFLTLSVLFSFLLGLPFLWKSVEIYRSPLPFRDIDAFSAQIESNPPQFPCRFQVIFVGFSNHNPSDLHLSIINEIHKLTLDPPQCGTCSNNFTLSVSVDPDSRVGAIDFSSDDDAVDEALKTALPGGSGLGGMVYSVLVVDGVGEMEGVTAVVGKYRHAWIIGKGLEAEAVIVRVAEIFVNVFVNGGREEGTIHGEFMPVGADGRIILSFNLLNADPRDGVYDWYGNVNLTFVIRSSVSMIIVKS